MKTTIPINKDYSFGPVENWVDTSPPTISSPAKDVDPQYGTILLFLDYQSNVFPEHMARYCQFCEKVLTQAGTARASELTINYSPSNQHIVIHKITVTRSELLIDKEKTCHFRVEQNERRQGEETFLGYNTLTLVLDDIRVGDEVNISYTLFGSDPAIKGHCAAWMHTSSNDISQWHRFRVVLPEKKELYYRNFITTIEPIITHVPDQGYKAYSWYNVPEDYPEYEENVPVWFEYHPYVEITDYKNWSEVVNTIAEYYRLPENIPSALAEKISKIKSEHSFLEEQVIACLKYVQNEIRYLSLDEPHLTYRPNTLNNITSHGFGDCKDKTFLLVTLFRMLEIETYPSLISFKHVFIPKETIPTFKLFDHIIVYARINHKDYWIDATDISELNNLEARCQISSGDTLLLKPGQNELIRLPSEDRSQVDIVETYDFTAGIKGAVTFKIVTTYYGLVAESMRWKLSQGSPAALSKDYLEYYQQFYPLIELHEQLKTENDLDNNVFTITESYLFPNPEAIECDEESFYIRAREISSHLKDLSSTVRKYPLAQSYPVKCKQVINLIFSKFKPAHHTETTEIQNGVFKFRCDELEQDNLLMRTLQYEALKDCILPEEFEQYKQDATKAEELAAFAISKDVLKGKWITDKTSKFTYFWIAFGLLALVRLIMRFVGS